MANGKSDKTELQDLNEQLQAKLKEQEQLGQEINDLTVRRDAARTATFDEKLVERAREVGLNPDNYRNKQHLKEAIHLAKHEQNPEQE